MAPLLRRPPFLTLAIVVSIGAVLFADAATPLGHTVWVLYLAPVALSLLTSRPAAPMVTAGVCTAALLVDYLLGRHDANALTTRVAIANRAAGIVTLWIVAVIVRQAIHARLRIAAQQWLDGGLARVTERLRGEQTAEELGDGVLRALAGYLGAPLAALYLRDGDGLRRAAGYALRGDGASRERFALGEGLVGQAARGRELLRVRDLPEGYAQVTSALGRARPRELVLAPLTADDEVNGVVELALLREASAAELELLGDVAEPIGLAFRSVQYRRELEELLRRTQEQAEELQTQSEELRVTNEELSQQSDALRDSQARLEGQQAELEQTNAHLEEQAQLLAHQRDELQRRKAELESASRYKSEFLANMSHELRTPLNSTLILAKLLADNKHGNLTEEQVRFARTIYAAGNDLLTLINDVLDLAKVEAGRLDVRPHRFSVKAFVDDLVQRFAPFAEEKKLELHAVVEPGAPEELETDPHRLRQVVHNLLSNAVKFTDAGSVTVRVSPAGHDRVAIAIADTGIGIAEDQHEAVFEAFRQADSTATRKHGGTGLGLAISRDLARLLAGELRLESAPGRGSTFTLTIPARIATPPRMDAPPAEAPRQRRAAAAPERRDGAPAATRLDGAWAPGGEGAPPSARGAPRGGDGRRTILVVEDDARFAEILADLARERGFDPRVATTAEEAFRIAIEEPPTGILLDVGLPDHSGLAVLDRLKHTAATRHVPVHVISAEDHAQAALAMGAVGYLVKPVEREQLQQIFHDVEERLTRKVRRILVVEDDPVQRESVVRLLSDGDVETTAVSTVAEALARLRETVFDCMVMDLSLPDASGYELLERMAREEITSFPPTIVYTGRTLTGEEEQRLRRYSGSIILKGARSPERLLDEVTLFLHRVEAELPPDRRRMLEQARSREAAFEGRRILVVEDDVRNLFALTAVLEPRGAAVEIARNGREALEALEKLPRVDLVLMDIMMPEMDGYDAMREIRRRDRFEKLPIIALTARAMRDDQDRCLAAGANDYIAKPIDVEKLLSLVRVWLPRQVELGV